MNTKLDLLKKSYVIGSKEWANDLLRFFLKEILYSDVWINHPYNKVILGYDIVDRLNAYGFLWQAERVKNHLHRWMKKISCTRARARDTLDQREREVS